MCNNHDSKQASNRMRFRLVRLQVSWLKRRALRLGFLMTILILVAMAWVILPNIERSGLLYGLLVVVCLWLFACGCLLVVVCLNPKKRLKPINLVLSQV